MWGNNLGRYRRNIRGIRKIILVRKTRLFWKSLGGRRRYLLPSSCILVIGWRNKAQDILFGELFHFYLSCWLHFGLLSVLDVCACLRLACTLFLLITLIGFLTRSVGISVDILWTKVPNILIHLTISCWEWAAIMKSISISIFLLILCSFRVFWSTHLFVSYMA